MAGGGTGIGGPEGGSTTGGRMGLAGGSGGRMLGCGTAPGTGRGGGGTVTGPMGGKVGRQHLEVEQRYLLIWGGVCSQVQSLLKCLHLS